MVKLFWSRLLLFLVAAGIPLFYPGVVVAYDRVSLLTWFVYVPVMMGAGFYVRPPQWRLRTMLVWPAAIAALFSFFAGWNRDGFVLTGVGLGAWILTALIFSGGYRGISLAVLEAFALGVVYYRLLSFARASEDVARAVSSWLVPLVVLAVAAFLLHGLLLYLAAFGNKDPGARRREVLTFAAVALPLCVILLLFLPVDFVRNDVVLNQLFEEPKARELPSTDESGHDDRGGGGKGEEQDERNGLPLGGRRTTDPRTPDGRTVDEGTDTTVREIRPDEHRTGRGTPRYGGEATDNPGGGRAPRRSQESSGDRNESGSGSQAQEDPSGSQRKEPSGQGGREGGSAGGSQSSGNGGNRPGDSGNAQSGKSDSGKSESGKSESGKSESGKSQGQKSEGQKNEKSESKSGEGDSKREKGESGRSGQESGQQKSEGQGGKSGKEQSDSDKERKQEPPPEKRENRLRGSSPDNYKPQWTRDTSPSQGDGGYQYALLIVASPVEPIYSAEAYWNEFDPKAGFRPSPDDFYNQVIRARLLETWKNPNTFPDEKRKAIEVRYLSAVPDRVVPYVPETIEPTRLSARYKPFDLSYRVRALVSTSTPDDWKVVTELTATEKKDLAKFLKADVDSRYAPAFRSALQKALKGKTAYADRVEAVQRLLSGYQYELGFDEDTSPGKLHDFLTKTKTGDCTEFSHTTALLARMAGIPARVVTGYVAGKETQTSAHRRGLQELRKRIEPLQSIPLDQLYLVTSMHRHAWPQFYIPGYGWVDFESTAFAKPPKPQFNPNNRDVVIPLIEKEKEATPLTGQRKINWRAVAIVAGLVVTAFLLLLYLYRYGRELYLLVRSRGSAPQAMEALYRLSLLRLAARGYPLKEPYETPLEYARRIPELHPLAEKYNEYRFRENLTDQARREARTHLRTSYRELWKRVRAGTLGLLGRVFSLRPLYY